MKTNNNNWNLLLNTEFEKDYYKALMEFLEKEYQIKTIFPPKNEIFTALELTPYDKVKVVVLGQDPYHGFNEAHGLAFSVKNGIKIPPSLRNIFKELKSQYPDFIIPIDGNLTSWAKNGVLLLNSTLTVEKDKANSHNKIGWSHFTDKVIEILNIKTSPIVFLLWGNFAISKENLITNPKHLVLKSPHPSPFSARKGFFGNNHFIKTNEFLKKNKIEPINWNLG